MIVYSNSEAFCKLRDKIFRETTCMFSKEEIERKLEGFNVRDSGKFTAVPLMQLFLHQMGSAESCGDTVAWGIAKGVLPANTCPEDSAYTNARNRLPEATLKDWAFESGTRIEGSARESELLQGRHVKVVDGSSVQLPDTPANQAEYPQHVGQKPGCGNPVMYLCALMGLVTQTILNVALAGGAGHERALFRELWASLVRGDIILGDRGFASFANFAYLLKMGVDVVFRERDKCLKNKETIALGRDEWLVLWDCPRQVGTWADRKQLPDYLVVRAIRHRVRAGKSGKDMIIFTTLLDREKYPKKAIIDLYYSRWKIELTFLKLKKYMKLELLKCKTPKRCRCELWVGLMAYNIACSVMLDAARKGRVDVSRISFTKTLRGLIRLFDQNKNQGNWAKAYDDFLKQLIRTTNPKRKRPSTKRTCKRRPKRYPLRTKPTELPSTLALCA